MPTYVRIRRLHRHPLRIGKVAITNAAGGSLIDVDLPAVQRDLKNADWSRFVFVQGSDAGVIETTPLASLFTDSTATNALTTALERIVVVELAAGTVITTATVLSGGTAAGTPLNEWAAISTSDGTNMTYVAVSADRTTGAIAANTLYPFTFATPYVVPATGFYGVHVMIKATTVPSLQSRVAALASSLNVANAAATAWTTNALATGIFKTGKASTAQTVPVAVASTAALSTVTADAIVPYIKLA